MEDGIQLVPIYPTFYWSVRSFKGQSDLLLVAIGLEGIREVAEVLVQVTLYNVDTGRVELFFLKVYQFVGQFGEAVRTSDGVL